MSSPDPFNPYPRMGESSTARAPTRYSSKSHLASKRVKHRVSDNIRDHVNVNNSTTSLPGKRKRRGSSPTSPRGRRNASPRTGDLDMDPAELHLPTTASNPTPTPPPTFTAQKLPVTPPRSLRRTVSQPASSPKDLSELFSPTNSPRPSDPATPRRPGGMRRMLTKTQSLGESLPIKSSPVEPISPLSSPARFVEAATLENELVDVSGLGEERPVVIAKRTYGRTRTMKEVEDVKPEEDEERQTYAELRQKYEIENEEGWPNATARPPLPVTDMRSKGENRRFLDEVGYLVEGLRDAGNSLSARRASSFDILRNLQDDGWASRVQVCDQSGRLWTGLQQARVEGDIVLDSIGLLFLATCARHTSGLVTILQEHAEQCLALITSGLQRDGPLETIIHAKGGTASQICHLEIMQAMLPRMISIWLLSRCLAIYRPVAETKNVLTSNLLQCMESEIDRADCKLELVLLCLNQISSLVVADDDETIEFNDTRSLVKALSCAKSVSKDEHASAVLLETLQILIYASKQCDPTLQLDTVAWMVVRRQYISQNLQESGVTGDAVLCLVLSLLTSSMDDRAAHEMSQILLSENCSGGLQCQAQCQCPDREPLPHHLANTFAEYASNSHSARMAEISSKPSNANLIQGYLGFVIVNILSKCPGNTSMLARIPGGDPVSKLRNLLGSLRHLEGLAQGDDAGAVTTTMNNLQEMISRVDVGDHV